MIGLRLRFDPEAMDQIFPLLTSGIEESLISKDEAADLAVEAVIRTLHIGEIDGQL